MGLGESGSAMESLETRQPGGAVRRVWETHARESSRKEVCNHCGYMKNAEKERVAGRSRGRIQENNKWNGLSGDEIKVKQLSTKNKHGCMTVCMLPSFNLKWRCKYNSKIIFKRKLQTHATKPGIIFLPVYQLSLAEGHSKAHGSPSLPLSWQPSSFPLPLHSHGPVYKFYFVCPPNLLQRSFQSASASMIESRDVLR